MIHTKKTITINAIIDINTETLESIVENENKATGFSKNESSSIDTAGKLGELISRFLSENDFDSFAKNMENYRDEKLKIQF